MFKNYFILNALLVFIAPNGISEDFRFEKNKDFFAAIFPDGTQENIGKNEGLEISISHDGAYKFSKFRGVTLKSSSSSSSSSREKQSYKVSVLESQIVIFCNDMEVQRVDLSPNQTLRVYPLNQFELCLNIVPNSPPHSTAKREKRKADTQADGHNLKKFRFDWKIEKINELRNLLKNDWDKKRDLGDLAYQTEQEIMNPEYDGYLRQELKFIFFTAFLQQAAVKNNPSPDSIIFKTNFLKELRFKSEKFFEKIEEGLNKIINDPLTKNLTKGKALLNLAHMLWGGLGKKRAQIDKAIQIYERVLNEQLLKGSECEEKAKIKYCYALRDSQEKENHRKIVNYLNEFLAGKGVFISCLPDATRLFVRLKKSAFEKKRAQKEMADSFRKLLDNRRNEFPNIQEFFILQKEVEDIALKEADESYTALWYI